jgi:predicted ATPase
MEISNDFYTGGMNIPKRYLKPLFNDITREELVKQMQVINHIAINILKQPKFIIEAGAMQKVYFNILLYFVGSDKTPYDLDKGLLVLGGVGSGKTMMFDIMKVYLTQWRKNSFIKVCWR